MLSAVDEFIEDKKMWFRDLHNKHGDEEKDAPIKVAKNADALREIDIADGEDPIQVKEELKKKMLELAT